MGWPDFQRARRFGRPPRVRAALTVVGVGAALPLPLLVVVLGLVAHLVLGSPSDAKPTDWVLGPWISGSLFAWPLGGGEHQCLLVLLALALGLGLVEVLVLWRLNRLVHQAAWGVVLRLMAEIHRQAYRLGASDLLDGRRTPPERLMTEATRVLLDGLVRWWSAVPFAVVAAGTLIALALIVNLWMALTVLLAVLLVVQIQGRISRRCDHRTEAAGREASVIGEQLLENLRLTPLATGYALPDAPGRPFDETLEAFGRASLRSDPHQASKGPCLLLLVLLAGTYILLVVGLSRYVTVAGTVVLVTALIGAYFPVARLDRLRGSLADADRAAGEIFAFLRRTPAVQQVQGAVRIDRVRRSIRLDQVTLASPDGLKLFDQLDLTIQAGRRVALLTSEPTAAMALAGLLVRLYDPAAGRILYDDFDIAHATLDTVRGQSLLVPADGMLFGGTVQENISCGDAGFTMLQVADAAKQARAQSFILDLPRGFSTHIGENGVRLSAIQAFHIGLARALLRDPSMLIVAEPPNEPDEAAHVRLDEALRLAAAERTLIVIPTRLRSLRAAQDVIVLHEGRVAAIGSHTELLKASSLYRHLNYVRFHAFRAIR